MGIRTSSEQPENQVASAERVRPLRTVAAAVKVNHLTSTNQSIQAENNQYFDGVTPPPTDKSGRGGKGRPLQLMWAGIRDAPPLNFQPQPREVKFYLLAGFN
ncbi:hypothetical protein J6590_061318 [Homalodisca vitripennis]|nr:hypothetical protein J6590_061318 [Homalodisca vitripennis]